MRLVGRDAALQLIMRTDAWARLVGKVQRLWAGPPLHATRGEHQGPCYRAIPWGGSQPMLACSTPAHATLLILQAGGRSASHGGMMLQGAGSPSGSRGSLLLSHGSGGAYHYSGQHHPAPGTSHLLGTPSTPFGYTQAAVTPLLGTGGAYTPMSVSTAAHTPHGHGPSPLHQGLQGSTSGNVQQHFSLPPLPHDFVAEEEWEELLQTLGNNAGASSSEGGVGSGEEDGEGSRAGSLGAGVASSGSLSLGLRDAILRETSLADITALAGGAGEGGSCHGGPGSIAAAVGAGAGAGSRARRRAGAGAGGRLRARGSGSDARTLQGLRDQFTLSARLQVRTGGGSVFGHWGDWGGRLKGEQVQGEGLG